METPDVVALTSQAADRLVAVLGEVIGGVLRNERRVATAAAVIAAVAVVDGRLAQLTNQLKIVMNVDGVAVVIVDGDTAHVVIMAGGEVANTQVLDEDQSVPAEDSYCKYSVAMSVPFVVIDAELDPALAGNPFVHLVRGYLGGTLVVQAESVGALCAVTDNPRVWSAEDKAFIHNAAIEVSAILERALLMYLKPPETT